MNEDINLRIKFIQEVERHPYLYDHNHVLYNHRDKIESTWQKIGLMFGEEGTDCKKKWRLIRCSYTRSLKAQSKQKSVLGFAKGYYMAPHLRFLDPFLKPRSPVDNNLSEEDEEVVEESADAVDSSHVLEVTLDGMKVERDGNIEFEALNVGTEDENSEPGLLLERKRPRYDEDGTKPDCPAKKLKEENVVKDLTSSEMYLLSLTPYVDDMTERQRLTFKRGVIELIEQIKYGIT